jgi:hypothetical protein
VIFGAALAGAVPDLKSGFDGPPNVVALLRGALKIIEELAQASVTRREGRQ